jgi:transposase
VKLFGVSLASIKRYLKQRKETGDVSPKAIPGRPSKKYAALEAGLVAQLEAHPDLTLEAHCQLWERTHSMWVDHTTMSRAIHRLGWTRKKNRQGKGAD